MGGGGCWGSLPSPLHPSACPLSLSSTFSLPLPPCSPPLVFTRAGSTRPGGLKWHRKAYESCPASALLLLLRGSYVSALYVAVRSPAGASWGRFLLWLFPVLPFLVFTVFIFPSPLLSSLFQCSFPLSLFHFLSLKNNLRAKFLFSPPPLTAPYLPQPYLPTLRSAQLPYHSSTPSPPLPLFPSIDESTHSS